MAIVSVSSMMDNAKKGNYAVGHFDVHNLEWIIAVLSAAKYMKSPVILGVTEDAVEYFNGFTVAKNTALSLVKEMDINVPVALHLDHGTTVENCIAAIDAGFTSVMIDASNLPLQENVRITKKVVDYAHPRGVTVEAEIGNIGGKEGGIVTNKPVYADIKDCIVLREKTNIDLLAPALGSAHGLYKGKPKLDFKKMREISQSVVVPLVLHGASGLSKEQIRESINSGTAKINVNADNHVAFTSAIRKELTEDEALYDATKYLKVGQNAVKEMVMNKIKLFGSAGEAFNN
ncbi:class II fructose-1,6-bisphosphate aldolase [Virgibacillus halodenitrificans]|uniref:class II fructose-1,6-bisphosphate aldolase n=1 Tax=Virgibacillus halodenitrificans TaxID=1482 RepID=UPI002DBEBC78|nr:class II fructose-1,6-bisphosphate aldolase [Virgibacillus halodenitrificans]MEC2159568.1 class II fructose-1,6-bisphosphate aldolase [Virgibacillus halodenitrificans]